MTDDMDHAQRLLAESRAMMKTLDPDVATWLSPPGAESIVVELRTRFERIERDLAELRERVTRLENQR